MCSAPRPLHRFTTRLHHGDEVTDPFAWLSRRDDSHVIAHLQAENAYAEAETAELGGLRSRLFEEIRTRTQEDDVSVPVEHRGWWYFSRTSTGQQYPVRVRVPVTADGIPPFASDITAKSTRDHESHATPTSNLDVTLAGEQVILDGNLEVGNESFFALGACEVDPGGDLVAFAVDRSGDERFALTIRDIASGAVLDRGVQDIGYGLVWSCDSRHVFYTRVDDAWRPHQVWRHEVGADPATDVLVHTEPDDRFWVGIDVSRDERWLVIGVGSKSTGEALLLDLREPLGPPRLVAERRQGVEYHVEPAGDRLLIVHNAERADFDVSWAPLTDTGFDQWQPWLAPAPGERIVDVAAFAGHVAVSLRSGGLNTVRLVRRDPHSPSGAGHSWDLPVQEELYSIGLEANPSWEATTVRYAYQSFVTPRTVAEYDLTDGTTTVLKRRQVLGGVDLDHYEQHRDWATAADGTQVPLSIVHHRDVVADGTAPLVVYAYGAYEASMDPYFSVARLSYLDRGVVYAVAHVRGGGEMGRSWYEGGRLAAKTNTFTDVVACTRHLLDAGWGDPSRVGLEGGSAGGLLVGATLNLAPHLYRVALAQVPFVDALTTMLDPGLPLTVTEWEEWGDPLHDPHAYHRMKAYTPYENIRSQEYPAILATTSLNDTRVSYAEPAKWVARLRETVTQDQRQRPVLLRTDLDAGHGGRSGRYDSWREFAWEAAFVLDQLDATRRIVPDSGPADGAMYDDRGRPS